MLDIGSDTRVSKESSTGRVERRRRKFCDDLLSLDIVRNVALFRLADTRELMLDILPNHLLRASESELPQNV